MELGAAGGQRGGQDGRRAAALEEVVALVGGGSDRAVPGTEGARATSPRVVTRFLAAYYRRAPIDDLVATPATTLVGAGLSHWELAQGRAPGEPKVAVRTPRETADGWETGHSVVEVVDDDLPFLVDSVRMALSRKGLGMHLMVHPVLRVRRDAAGRIVDVGEYEGPEGGDPGDGSVVESFIHVEVDRQRDPGILADLEAELRRVERDVRAAAEDWPAMLDALEQTVADLESGACSEGEDEVGEATSFLRWAAAGHLTFLGCRDYDLSWRGDHPELHPVPATGLGILGDLDGDPEEGWRLPDKRAADPGVVVLTKAAARSTVHRPAHLDQVSVTRYDRAGQVVGERRFLGLYTPVVYETHPAEIPVVRRKVTAVVDRAGFPPGSHSGRELRSVLETYPRDELFEIATDELFDIAMGICDLQERQQVRLFTRGDRYGRFVSCLVFVPREPLDTETERALVQMLVEAFGGRGAESQIRLSESVLARLHVLISLGTDDEGQLPPARVDLQAVEASLARVVRSWSRDLKDALVGDLGEDEGLALARRYESAFPRGYQVDFDARTGVADLGYLEALDPAGDLDVNLYRPLQAAPGTARVKLYRAGSPLPVSRLLPLLEHLGVEVVDERPYEVRPAGSPSRWVYDFGVRAERVSQLAGDEARDQFHRAFLAVWEGRAEDDGLNRLVVRAGIAWRDVAVLRAYARYLRQTGSALSNEYLQEALVANPEVAILLVRAFHARFAPMAPAGPEGEGGSVEERRAASWARLAQETAAAIDRVASLDQDRILRSFLGLVEATVRTTAFRPGSDGAPRTSLALKLDPSRVPGLPRPRPAVEVFVYSPRTEGVHLRGGRVARGGIRWSDRREDFRTEILSLMKAQMVKNAVIVPVGAKGGFVVKRPPEDPAALHQEVVACYQTLVAGMLDLSDNLVGGQVTHPPEVLRYDGDDPYLVVAADKGTATFSDVANAIAVERGYWLGDAFAAGGSTGYDHKALGITARGAWEAVRRHFAAMGQDADAEELTVVGIGDMSGDVFGNGLLRSHHLKLVAAFDHRHIFVDPDPDPETSYQERARLFDLPRSSWADYDPAALSPGGGVFSRAAKSVTLSLEAQAALGVDADVLTPDEVIRAILRAPVDLLWNGGIGTYVKAGAETDAEVGDRTNDGVRVDAGDLRCRVVGEGGNLGLTQAARVELALAGGKVNTDAIDNAGGVDCSDHEVNIKVLLDGAVAAGALPGGERDRLLADMADEVAELVLAHNRRQTQALADAAAEAPSLVDVHRRYLRSLEQEGKLDRDLEHLPTDEALDDRGAAGRGLTSPELAVLSAYAKNLLYEDLLGSDLPDDPFLAGELAGYFPARLGRDLACQLGEHPLRREIIANQVAGEVVDRQGPTFVHRLVEETGATAPEVVRAYLVAREVLGLPGLWAAMEDAGPALADRDRSGVALQARREVWRAVRWLLAHRRPPLHPAAEVARFARGAAELLEGLGQLRQGNRGAPPAGSPAGVVGAAGLLEPLGRVFDLVEVAADAGASVGQAAAVHAAVGERLGLGWLGDQVLGLSDEGRWEAQARDVLRDEVAAQHRAITQAVLAGTDPTPEPGEALAGWLAHHGDAVARVDGVLADLRAAAAPDLAALTVAARAYRPLAADGTAALGATCSGAGRPGPRGR